MRRHHFGAGVALALLPLPPHAAIAAAAGPRIPPAECEAHAGYDRDTMLPGYLLPTSLGPATCIPFTATAAHPPAGYAGKDFYVDEFTDAKLREAWAACKADSACNSRLSEHIARRLPPNREYRIADPRALFLLGKVDAGHEVDLKTIRRPAFFARAPYREAIAEAESRTFTVEFTAPREPYEQLKLNLHDSIKLRGWYVQGRGIEAGKGHEVRGLIIMSNGGGGRIVAIEDPADHLYHIDPATGRSVLNSFPNQTTGASGQRDWRQFLYVLNRAGFDVLSYDRRGVGISGGYSDTNTLQQGRDILEVIASLKSGSGVRVLTPKGKVLAGQAASAALLGGAGAERMPILLLGSSRGTMATGWAMTRNFDKTCDYDLETVSCGPPVGYRNIRGALMLADFTSGVGYVTTNTTQEDRDRALFIGGTESDDGIVFFPSSAILAGVGKWPGLFIGRGLWDYAESLEGALDAYDRVQGPKELVVVRGPHPFEVWPEQERKRVGERMIAFARAAALGQSSVPGGRPWSDMKELVATAADVWEPSSRPAAPN